MHAEILDDARRLVIDSGTLRTPSLTDRSASSTCELSAGQSSTVREGRNDAREPVRLALAGFSVEGRPWTVAVMRSMKAITAQESRSLRHALLVTVAALTFGLLLARVLSALLSRPIVRLTHFATQGAKVGPQPKPTSFPPRHPRGGRADEHRVLDGRRGPPSPDHEGEDARRVRDQPSCMSRRPAPGH